MFSEFCSATCKFLTPPLSVDQFSSGPMYSLFWNSVNVYFLRPQSYPRTRVCVVWLMVRVYIYGLFVVSHHVRLQSAIKYSHASSSSSSSCLWAPLNVPYALGYYRLLSYLQQSPRSALPSTNEFLCSGEGNLRTFRPCLVRVCWRNESGIKHVEMFILCSLHMVRVGNR